MRLALNVVDGAGGVGVKLTARKYKVGLSGGLPEFFEDNEIKYTIQ
jgi:hypothetical protein